MYIIIGILNVEITSTRKKIRVSDGFEPMTLRDLTGRYRRIHADVIVYIFAHLHTALRTEGNMLDMN